jgi:hypothetical protein
MCVKDSLKSRMPELHPGTGGAVASADNHHAGITPVPGLCTRHHAGTIIMLATLPCLDVAIADNHHAGTTPVPGLCTTVHFAHSTASTALLFVCSQRVKMPTSPCPKHSNSSVPRITASISPISHSSLQVWRLAVW